MILVELVNKDIVVTPCSVIAHTLITEEGDVITVTTAIIAADRAVITFLEPPSLLLELSLLQLSTASSKLIVAKTGLASLTLLSEEKFSLYPLKSEP